MEDNEDVFSKIENLAEQVMQFVVCSACTLALLIFRPFRAITKLFTEDGQLRRGYVRPVAFAVLTSFIWFLAVQLLTAKAFISYLFSNDHLMSVYERLPHDFDLFNMVLSVGPMLLFIHFAARLVTKALGVGADVTCYRIILYGCSAQCLLFPFAYFLHVALGFWRFAHLEPSQEPGFHFSTTAQVVYWVTHFVVSGYLLVYPGFLLLRGLRLVKAKHRPHLARVVLGLVLACGVAGPGFIAVGAGTSTFKALFREKEKAITLNAVMGIPMLMVSSTNKFSFDVDLIVQNQTAEPILLKNSELQVEFSTEDGKHRSFPTIVVTEGADHPKTVRLLGPGQAIWLPLRLEDYPRNLGLKARGESQEFTGKIRLTAGRFLGLEQGKGLPETEPFTVKVNRLF
jgi:hypothetical protein